MSLHIDPLDGTSFGAVVTGAKMASLGEADWQALYCSSSEHLGPHCHVAE